MTEPITGTWHFYDDSTGVFTGASFSGAAADLAAQLLAKGAGIAAWPGEADHRRQRVNVLTDELVAYTPPEPAATTLVAWAWDAQQWRWLPVPTEAALAIEVRAERDRRLAACDWVVARATELAQAVPTGWSTYRAALRDVPQQEGFPSSITWPTPPV